jgi:hypothetical protein
MTTKRSKADELLQKRIDRLPIWIRPPKRDVEFYSGLSRPKLYELAAKGKIVTRTLREPGQTKGTRLFLLSSILNFIENCSDGMHRDDANQGTKLPPTQQGDHGVNQ